MTDICNNRPVVGDTCRRPVPALLGLNRSIIGKRVLFPCDQINESTNWGVAVEPHSSDQEDWDPV